MAYKDPLNLHLPPQGQGPFIEPNNKVELGPLRATAEVATPPAFVDHHLYFQALREMLESDNYQIALVPRGELHLIRGSRADPISTAARVVLLPFRWKELVARVCEFMRDSNPTAENEVARFEDVCVDFTGMTVSRLFGEPVALTTQEFKTLKCFLLNPDRVFSRAQLLSEAWGYENYPSTRTVDNCVLKLRRKLEKDPARPVHFRTVHGVGYRFVP